MTTTSSTSPPSGGTSLLTVLVALGANALVAVAKSVAAALSGSASMVAEAAHSWADTGNEALLLVAERQAGRVTDASHPLGYGRAAYVWSMVAAFGLFTAGSILSITHGISELGATGEDSDYLLSYIVLGVSAVLEGISFSQAVRQTRASARLRRVHPLRFIMATSETTLRAVFFEDAAALIGLVFAASGLALHEITGNAVYDAAGSILVGLLLGVVALVLLIRNGQFLIGEAVSPEVRAQVLRELLAFPDVERVTFLHMEYVGPSKIFLVAAVDLTRDDVESVLAGRIQAIEDRLNGYDYIQKSVVSLSAPGEDALSA